MVVLEDYTVTDAPGFGDIGEGEVGTRQHATDDERPGRGGHGAEEAAAPHAGRDGRRIAFGGDHGRHREVPR